MKKVSCTLKGVSPLLMHQFPMVPVEAIEKKPPEEQAEISAYRIPAGNAGAGELYIPAIAIQRSLVSSATYSKGKGRGSLQKVVAACVIVSPEYASLGRADYAVDARAVVIPATKGRIVRYRPRVDDWSVVVDIEWDENLLTEAQMRRVVDDAGSRVGLLDFRPERKGPFGRFVVNGWSE